VNKLIYHENMADSKKHSWLSFSFISGVILGGLGGLFFAPKQGRELRRETREKIKEVQAILKEKGVNEKVKKIYGEATKETKKQYQRVRKDLVLRLSALEKGISEIDKGKYLEIVDEVLANLKKEPKKTSQKALVKLKKSLRDDWQLLSTKIVLKEKTEGKK